MPINKGKITIPKSVHANLVGNSHPYYLSLLFDNIREEIQMPISCVDIL